MAGSNCVGHCCKNACHKTVYLFAATVKSIGNSGQGQYWNGSFHIYCLERVNRIARFTAYGFICTTGMRPSGTVSPCNLIQLNLETNLKRLPAQWYFRTTIPLHAPLPIFLWVTHCCTLGVSSPPGNCFRLGCEPPHMTTQLWVT